MSDAPRLRFAPSPTGMFHVGSGRTALFNWLYAHRYGGKFVLRIEDTDNERNSEEWVQGILDAMQWLGLDWDEGPNRQTTNAPQHIETALKLYEQGNAYYCDCTREIVDERTKGNATPGYDRFCRDRDLGPGEGRALRFRVPEGRTVVHDLIRGDVEFENNALEDFVLLRSNGVPVFVHANVVDDMIERISHVVRGEEHLPNTPKQVLIWNALDPEINPPTYAHLPVIVNEARKKLSKRRDKVALEMYRDEGYLPEAMRNYLVLLGWAPKGDREIVSVQTMIDEFDLRDVQKSSAFFDIKKLNHFNGEYIRALPVDEFITRAQPFLDATDLWPKESFDSAAFVEMAPLVQERIVRLDEVAPMVDFLFVDELVYPEEAIANVQVEANGKVFLEVMKRYGEVVWTAAALHDVLLQVAEEVGLKLGKAQAPIRYAVTGKKVGPPLFESMQVLGRDRTLARMTQLAKAASLA